MARERPILGRVEMIWPPARMYRESGEEIRIGDIIRSDERLSLMVTAADGDVVTASYAVSWQQPDRGKND